MATDDLMYYCLQLSLFINGGFVAFALGKTALTRPGTVAILALASFVAAFCAGFFAPHFTVLDSPAGRAYCLYTAAGRFFMVVFWVGPFALMRWLKQKP